MLNILNFYCFLLLQSGTLQFLSKHPRLVLVSSPLNAWNIPPNTRILPLLPFSLGLQSSGFKTQWQEVNTCLLKTSCKKLQNI